MNMQKVFEHYEPKMEFEEIPASTDGNGVRHYNTPMGKYPSVTTVVGWEKRKFFAEWRKENPKESKRCLNRGNVLHELIEDYLNNKEINLMSVSPTVATLFMQIKPALDDLNNIRALEVPLYSHTLGLAGRVDCVAEHNGVLSIVDFKGSNREKRENDIENYFLQGCAYALMWQERTGEPINEFRILVANEEGSPCQVFSGKVIDYVKRLFEVIENFKKNQLIEAKLI